MNVQIKGNLTFDTVTSHLDNIVRSLSTDSAAELRVDLAAVNRTDSAGLSLLLEILRTAIQHGRAVRFCNPSPEMRALARFFELDATLGRGHW